MSENKPNFASLHLFLLATAQLSPHRATFSTQKGECETAFCCEMAHSNEIEFSTLVSPGKEELLLFPNIIVII